MNSIIRAPFTEEQRKNITRYQADNKLSDRLVCPRLVNGKECEENYMVPGMHTFFPLFRPTVLRLGDDDALYCPQCKVSIQDWVPFVVAEYDEDVQKAVHVEIAEEIERKCNAMTAKSLASRTAVFDRLRAELSDIRHTEIPSPPNQYYHHEYCFDDYPHLRLSVGYDGEVAVQYSIGSFVQNSNNKRIDYRTVQHFFGCKWEGSMKDHLKEWADLTSQLPSFDVVPLK